MTRDYVARERGNPNCSLMVILNLFQNPLAGHTEIDTLVEMLFC